MRYKVAAVQVKLKEREVDDNLLALKKYIKAAVKEGANIVVLPETCNVGSLNTTREEVLSYAETISGRTVSFFSELSKQLGVYLAFGFVEKDQQTDLVYNTNVLTDSQGEIVGKYRKNHIFSTETNFIVNGNLGFPVFETEYGRIGMLICEDMVHFESVRLLALQKIDVLLMSTCWVDDGPDDSWRTRALENGIYIVCSDWWSVDDSGKSIGGGSCVIDPDGNLVTYMEKGDGFVCAEIDTVRNKRQEILSERRKDKYHLLMQDTYLWGNGNLDLPPARKSRAMILAKSNIKGIQGYLDVIKNKMVDIKGADLVVLPPCDFEILPEQLILEIQKILSAGCSENKDKVFVVGFHGELTTMYLFDKNSILLSSNTIHDTKSKEVSKRGAFQIVDSAIGRVSLLNSADMFYPESLRCLARQGADMICMSDYWDRERIFLLNERRLFNDVILLASLKDKYGSYSYYGDPDVIEIGEKEEMLLREINTDNDFIRNKIDIRKARIDLYEGLLTF